MTPLGRVASVAAIALWIAAAMPMAARSEGPGVFTPKETADQPLLSENESWPRRLHDLAHLPDWLDFGVEHRTRFEFMDDPWRPGEKGSDGQFALRTRARVGFDLLDPVRFLVELEDARAYLDDGGDFTNNQINHIDVLQALATVRAEKLFGTELRADLHVGRFGLDVGSRRLLARNRFRNTTNSFDGVHAQIASGTAWRARAFWTWPVVRGVHGFDDEVISDQRFWGAVFESHQLPWLNGELFWFGLDDDQAGSPRRDYDTFGARALRPPKPGHFDYELEVAGQVGERNGVDHRAWMGHGEVAYGFASRWTPRVVLQVQYSSGSGDPNGESETFDPLFGARRFDIGPTGILGIFRRSNTFSPGVRVQAAPAKPLRVQLKYRYWALAEGKDAFSGNNLRDPTGDAGRDLGHDVELQVLWTPYPWLTIDAGYDRWFKGRYLEEVSGVPSTQDTDYAYFSVLIRI